MKKTLRNVLNCTAIGTALLCSVIPISSNAINLASTIDDIDFSEYTLIHEGEYEGFDHYFDYYNNKLPEVTSAGKGVKIYFSNSQARILILSPSKVQLMFQINDNVDIEDVKKSMNELSDKGIEYYSIGESVEPYNGFDCYIWFEPSTFDLGKARIIADMFAENNYAEKIELHGFNSYTISEAYKKGPWEDLLSFEGKELDKVTEYLDSINFEYTVKTTGSTDELGNEFPGIFTIIPDKEMTQEEKWQLNSELNVYTEGGITWLIPADSNREISGSDIALDWKTGDANCDKGVGLADALAILQYVANAEKYPLTAQELFNADIVGDGDGVTPLDALEIQKWDAFKII